MLKKIYTHFAAIVCLMLSFSITHAQEKLWGIKDGSVFHMNTDGSELVEAVKENGTTPKGVILGPDSLLYGIVGNTQSSSIYSFQSSNAEFKYLARLPDQFHVNDFILESPGIFYVTGFGPDTVDNTGNLYYVIKVTNGVSEALLTEQDFQLSSLVDGEDGRLYLNALSTTGGAIVGINMDGTNYTIVHQFTSADGTSPIVQLILSGDSSLVGATLNGGLNGRGTIYKVNRDGSDFTVLRHLASFERIYHHGGKSLLKGSDGIIYWMQTNSQITPFLQVLGLKPDGTLVGLYSLRNANPGNLTEYGGFLNGLSIDPDFEIFHADLASESLESTGGQIEPWEGTFDLLGALATGTDGKIYGTLQQFTPVKETAIFSYIPPFPTFDSRKTEYSFQANSAGSDVIFLTPGSDNAMYGVKQTVDQTTIPAFQMGSVFSLTGTGFKNLVGTNMSLVSPRIVEGNDGFIYGIEPGCENCGGAFIFRVKKDGTAFQRKNVTTTPLKSIGNLLRTKDGDIIGLTEGRLNAPSVGYIFRFKPDLQGIETIVNFSRDKGQIPLGDLIEGTDGFLYGTTSKGGLFHNGVVFKVRSNGQDYTKLHEFSGPDGKSPNGGLAIDAGGNLYGTTQEGGSHDFGTIFKVKGDGTSFEVIHQAGGSTLLDPMGDVFLDKAGFLYGFSGTHTATGSIFKIKTDGSNLSILLTANNLYLSALDFQVAPETYVTYPADSAVNIPVNLTVTATTIPNAVRYTLDISTSPVFDTVARTTTSPVPSFEISGLDASTIYYARVKTSTMPYYGIVTQFTTASPPIPPGARLWGVTTAGGAHPCQNGTGGTIFSISTDGSSFIKHFDYNCVNDTSALEYGKKLHGSLLLGKDNRLYGIGVNITLPSRYEEFSRFWPISNGTAGEIFSINTDGEDFISHYDRLNIHEYGDLMQFSNGDLYLTNPNSYNVIEGNIFGHYPSLIRKVNPDGGTDSLQSIIHQYSYGFGGRDPRGPLIELPDGYLYGTTTIGGLHGRGVIYKIRADGSDFIKLHDFTVGTPRGGLLDGKDGYLYGMDLRNNGTIYKIKTDGTSFTILHLFGGSRRTNGWDPEGELIEFEGTLYGMTSGGGVFGKGLIFRIEKDGSNFTILHHFNQTDGARPLGTLTLDDGANFYGMTSAGGTNNMGVIFTIETNGSGFAKIFDFSQQTGGAPNGRLLLINDTIPENKTYVINPTDNTEDLALGSPAKGYEVTVYPNPSSVAFKVSNESNTIISFTVADVNGMLLEPLRSVSRNESVELGNNFGKGIYLLKVITGNSVKVYRLIKN